MDDLVQEIFLQTLEMEPADREAFLESACNGNSKLRSEVEALLQESAQADSYFAVPDGTSTINPHAQEPAFSAEISAVDVNKIECCDVLASAQLANTHTAELNAFSNSAITLRISANDGASPKNIAPRIAS